MVCLAHLEDPTQVQVTPERRLLPHRPKGNRTQHENGRRIPRQGPNAVTSCGCLFPSRPALWGARTSTHHPPFWKFIFLWPTGTRQGGTHQATHHPSPTAGDRPSRARSRRSRNSKAGPGHRQREGPQDTSRPTLRLATAPLTRQLRPGPPGLEARMRCKDRLRLP